MHVQLIERFIRMVNYSPDECAFMAEIEIELLNILEPKLKSVLQQTSLQNRDDLEQELKIIVLKKIKKGLNAVPSFFELIKEDNEIA